MGFNVVRVNGLQLAIGDDTNSIIQSQPAYIQDPNDPYLFVRNDSGEFVKDFLFINDTNYEMPVKLIEEFVNIVKEHNVLYPDTMLRVSFITGLGGLWKESENYANYLSYLGEYFKDEPTIFSWEINSEPEIFDDPPFNLTKTVEAYHFGQWYYSLKQASPRHFITFGSTRGDIKN